MQVKFGVVGASTERRGSTLRRSEQKAKRGAVEGRRGIGQYRRAMADSTPKRRGREKTFSDRSRLLPIRLEPEDYVALRVLAAEKGTAMSVLVRTLIREELRKHGKISPAR